MGAGRRAEVTADRAPSGESVRSPPDAVGVAGFDRLGMSGPIAGTAPAGGGRPPSPGVIPAAAMELRGR